MDDFDIDLTTIFSTVFDEQKESRVLEVYQPSSIPLSGAAYEKPVILHSLFTPESTTDPNVTAGISMATNNNISFDFRVLLDTGTPNDFEMIIIGEGYGETVSVRLLPMEPPAGSYNIRKSTNTMHGIAASVTGANAGIFLEINVFLGHSLLDGYWHGVQVDLGDAIAAALEDVNLDANQWGMETATAVELSGQMFGLDNLMFRSIYTPEYPVLFEMGPLYAEIFEPYTYIFVADYTGSGIKTLDKDGKPVKLSSIFQFMLDPETHFLYGDANDPNDEVYKYYVDELGADPNLFGENDPNVAETLGLPFFIVDFALPVFADPNLRSGGSQADLIKESATLGWNARVNGYGANGIQAYLLEPLSTVPYDGMPTYLPAYYNAIEAASIYGSPSFPPEAVIALEAALWNSGVSVWPNVAALNYTPQYFEDLIVTIEVTNGVHSDFMTFPFSVVNDPVENYAPVPQLDIDNQIFYVDKPGTYLINFLDPDCFIFSQAYNLNGQTPTTTHVPANTPGMAPRDDMSQLVWNMTLNGLPTYQYGPWVDSIIDQESGIISWVPQFEGAYDAVVTCSDNHGGTAFGELTIFWKDPETDAGNAFLSDTYYDADGDGYGTYPEDCSDNDATIYPGAVELCDGKDNDCDGIIPSDEVDEDKDGFLACNDCDDQDNMVYPGAPGTREGKDNNCNRIMDKDERRQAPYRTYTPAIIPWVQYQQSWEVSFPGLYMDRQRQIQNQYQFSFFQNQLPQAIDTGNQFWFFMTKPYWQNAFLTKIGYPQFKLNTPYSATQF